MFNKDLIDLFERFVSFTKENGDRKFISGQEMIKYYNIVFDIRKNIPELDIRNYCNFYISETIAELFKNEPEFTVKDIKEKFYLCKRISEFISFLLLPNSKEEFYVVPFTRYVITPNINHIANYILSFLEKERNAFVMDNDRTLFLNIIEIIKKIDDRLYLNFYYNIEKEFLINSKEFYSFLSKIYIQNYSGIDLLNRLFRVLSFEMDRNFSDNIKHVINTNLIYPCFDSLKIEEYFNQNQLILTSIFSLYTESEEIIKLISDKFVNNSVKIPDNISASMLFDSIFKNRSIVENYFLNHPFISKQLYHAYKKIINSIPNIHEQVNLYIHHMLITNKSIPDEVITQFLYVYSCIDDKDVVENYFLKMLGERLISPRNISENEEIRIIEKFNEGGISLSKAIGMINDFKNSKYNWIENTTFVLTEFYWNFKFKETKIPSQLYGYIDSFTQSYTNKYNNRKLKWCLDQGYAEVYVNFGETIKIITCTTYMMIILLYIKDGISFKELSEECGGDISEHLLSLCHPSNKILLKNPNTPVLNDTDRFAINRNFQHASYKITIPLRSFEKQKHEETKILEIQRSYVIDSAIIRIMKTRKQLSHNILISETVEQLQKRFKPDLSLIKKRIDLLIDQEYIERTEDNRTLYNYVV